MGKTKNLLLLLLCGSFFMMCALGSGTDPDVSNDSNGTEAKTNDQLKTYKLNEDIYITNNSGKYRVKFTSIKETKERNDFTDTKADRVVILEWEYENLTIEEDLLISDMLNFKLYDKDNNKLESYPVVNGTKYGGNVGKGRKTVSSEAYALNSAENYIELEFYDNVWNSKPDCKVIVEW